MDFALVVTFIGMLIPGLRGRPILVCAIVAGVTAVLLSGLPNRLGLMAATLAGVAAALISWRTKNLLLTIVLGMAIFLYSSSRLATTMLSPFYYPLGRYHRSRIYTRLGV